jgi:hypothetical protein
MREKIEEDPNPEEIVYLILSISLIINENKWKQ